MAISSANNQAPKRGNEARPFRFLDTVHWPLTILVGVLFYMAAPYVLNWSTTIYKIGFGLEGGEDFQLLQVVQEGSTGRRLAMLALLALGLDALLRRNKYFRLRGMHAHMLVLYVVLATMSMMWAEDPGLTARKIIILWCMFAGAAGVASRLSLRGIVSMTVVLTGATLLLSLGAEIALGSFRPWSGSYRFSGIMHPVSQGWTCGLLFLSAFSLALCNARPRHMLWLLAFAGLAGILLTRSRWPLVTCMAGTVVVLHFAGSLRSKALIVLWLGVLGGVLLLIMLDSPGEGMMQLATMGRGETAAQELGTFTGRLGLWKELLALWAERPVLGYGYNAFQIPSIINYLEMVMAWIPANSHCGYIQTLLGLGVAGLATFVLLLAFSLARAWSLARKRTLNCFLAAVLVWLGVNLLLETALVTEPFLPTFIVYVVIVRLCLFSPREELETAEENKGVSA